MVRATDAVQARRARVSVKADRAEQDRRIDQAVAAVEAAQEAIGMVDSVLAAANGEHGRRVIAAEQAMSAAMWQLRTEGVSRA